jgi:3-mercaptopyruvate sulfurtransferase SseA
MRKGRSHWLLVAIASSLFIVQPALAAERSDSQLVSVQWLEKNLKRDDVLVIDASPAKLHSAGHIPGAVNVVGREVQLGARTVRMEPRKT